MTRLVLSVDDSNTVRKIIETCLHREGYEVVGFSDGIAAMKWLTETERVPDLIFMDVMLPKMDGFEVTRRIKQKAQYRYVVVVFLSRHNGMIDKIKGRLAGGKAYLSKPFKTQDVIDIVELYIGKAEEG